jgi:hypothetical protein
MEDGIVFERLYMKEIACFKNAHEGVRGDDGDAALLLREAGKMELVELLHQRVIRVVVSCREGTRWDELYFVST